MPRLRPVGVLPTSPGLIPGNTSPTPTYTKNQIVLKDQAGNVIGTASTSTRTTGPKYPNPVTSVSWIRNYQNEVFDDQTNDATTTATTAQILASSTKQINMPGFHFLLRGSGLVAYYVSADVSNNTAGDGVEVSIWEGDPNFSAADPLLAAFYNTPTLSSQTGYVQLAISTFISATANQIGSVHMQGTVNFASGATPYEVYFVLGFRAVTGGTATVYGEHASGGYPRCSISVEEI